MLSAERCQALLAATSDDRTKMRQGRKVVSALTPCKWFANCLKGRKRHKMRSFSKIKQSCRTVFTKQLSLVNLAVMSIIMNYLPKSNGKENCLKSRFCLSCKNDEMSLRSFWHNTVAWMLKSPAIISGDVKVNNRSSRSLKSSKNATTTALNTARWTDETTVWNVEHDGSWITWTCSNCSYTAGKRRRCSSTSMRWCTMMVMVNAN